MRRIVVLAGFIGGCARSIEPLVSASLDIPPEPREVVVAKPDYDEIAQSIVGTPEIARFLEVLASGSLEERDEACAKLLRKGQRMVPALKEALARATDLEVQAGIVYVIARLQEQELHPARSFSLADEWCDMLGDSVDPPPHEDPLLPPEERAWSLADERIRRRP